MRRLRWLCDHGTRVVYRHEDYRTKRLTLWLSCPCGTVRYRMSFFFTYSERMDWESFAE